MERMMASEKAAQLRQLLTVARMLRQAAIDDAMSAPLFRAAAHALEDNARRKAFHLPDTGSGTRYSCNIVF